MLIAVILAGGTSSRFGFNINKCLYQVFGKPMIMHVYSRILASRCSIDIYAVTSMRDVEDFYSLGLKVVIDNYLAGPLPALYQVLKMFSNVFVVGCDMPLIESESIRRLVSMCPKDADVCIPRWGSTRYVEPLFAIYRNGLLDLLERCFYRRELSIAKCLNSYRESISIRYLDVNDVFAKPYIELFNFNTFKDLEQIYALLGSAHVQ